MSLVLYFIVAFVLSFLGSLPIGLITLTITQKTIEKGKQSGFMIASGATIIEFVYTYIALISLEFFTENTAIGNYIKLFSMIIFFGLGGYFLFKKSAVKIQSASTYDYFDFLRGLIVGMMNMLIIPFWIFLAIWLMSNGMLFDEDSSIISFSLGSAIGAFLAFLLYIWFSGFITKKVKAINQYTNKAIGVLFIGLALFQVFHLLYT